MKNDTMGLVFLDTETTSLENGRLVELAYDGWRGGGITVQRFKPPVPITFEAMATHHITEKMVAGLQEFDGSHAKEVLEDQLEAAVLVAHNAPFDVGVLQREGVEVKEFIDTKRIAQRLLPDFPSHRLQYLRYALGLEVEAEAHSAAGDVKVLKAVFERLMMQVMEPGDLTEDDAVALMLAWTHEPVMLKLVPFGKHKGKPWEQVAKEAPDYLEWALRQDFGEDVKHTITQLLNAAKRL